MTCAGSGSAAACRGRWRGGRPIRPSGWARAAARGKGGRGRVRAGGCAGGGSVAGRPPDPTVGRAGGAARKKGGPGPRQLEGLRGGGIDAVTVRRRGWPGALGDSAHAAVLLALGGAAQSPRRIRALLALG